MQGTESREDRLRMSVGQNKGHQGLDVALQMHQTGLWPVLAYYGLGASPVSGDVPCQTSSCLW